MTSGTGGAGQRVRGSEVESGCLGNEERRPGGQPHDHVDRRRRDRVPERGGTLPRRRKSEGNDLFI